VGFWAFGWGTGIRGLTRSSATLPRGHREHLMVKDNGFQLASFILQVSVVDTWCTYKAKNPKCRNPNESQMQMGRSPEGLELQ